jgi:RNA polymerase sigma-70 factor (ECF subfamily)
MSTLCDVTDGTASDELLLREVIEERSGQALEKLYRRHRALLAVVVMRVVRADWIVDDVLQDVFVQVWTQGDRYSPDKGQVLGWLITLARRRALDRLRQRYAYQKATDRFEVEHERHAEEEDVNCMVDRDVCSHDLRHLMFTLISHLPEAQQKVITMTYFEDLSQRQIASQLDLPLGTVKTRIELGMRKLSNALVPMREKVA